MKLQLSGVVAPAAKLPSPQMREREGERERGTHGGREERKEGEEGGRREREECDRENRDRETSRDTE